MASITITVPDAEVPRVAAAIGNALGLRDSGGLARSATAAEMRAWVVTEVKQITRGYETNLAVTTAATTVTDIGAS